jgi:hypothetical protein
MTVEQSFWLFAGLWLIAMAFVVKYLLKDEPEEEEERISEPGRIREGCWIEGYFDSSVVLNKPIGSGETIKFGYPDK